MSINNALRLGVPLELKLYRLIPFRPIVRQIPRLVSSGTPKRMVQHWMIKHPLLGLLCMTV